jgi:hypothetical protein
MKNLQIKIDAGHSATSLAIAQCYAGEVALKKFIVGRPQDEYKKRIHSSKKNPGSTAAQSKQQEPG